jgi:hypothetical protein
VKENNVTQDQAATIAASIEAATSEQPPVHPNSERAAFWRMVGKHGFCTCPADGSTCLDQCALCAALDPEDSCVMDPNATYLDGYDPAVFQDSLRQPEGFTGQTDAPPSNPRGPSDEPCPTCDAYVDGCDHCCGVRPAASEDPRSPGWVRVLRAKTGLALTPDPWGHWCCQAGAMANPGPCPWHPVASGDTTDQAARTLAFVEKDRDAALEVARQHQARIEEALKIHSQFRVYDECGHQHEDDDPDVIEIDEIGLTCGDGYLYSICANCCTGGSREWQTETCASEHKHDGDAACWPCPTRIALTEEQQ